MGGQQLATKEDFDRETKLEAFRIREKLNQVNANTFLPLVLFNREETVRLLRESKGDLEKLRKMI
jgi:hypothetical protein